MAKRRKKKSNRLRGGVKEPRSSATLTASQVQRQVQRWRTLKTRFDRAHRAGLDALSRRDYARFGAAIAQERRIIHELGALVRAAAEQVSRWKIVARRV